MTIDILRKHEQKKLQLMKMCSMFRRDDKHVLQLDLSDFPLKDADKIIAVIRESCQIAALQGYAITVEKKFVQDKK